MFKIPTVKRYAGTVRDEYSHIDFEKERRITLEQSTLDRFNDAVDHLDIERLYKEYIYIKKRNDNYFKNTSFKHIYK